MGRGRWMADAYNVSRTRRTRIILGLVRTSAPPTCARRYVCPSVGRLVILHGDGCRPPVRSLKSRRSLSRGHGDGHPEGRDKHATASQQTPQPPLPPPLVVSSNRHPRRRSCGYSQPPPPPHAPVRRTLFYRHSFTAAPVLRAHSPGCTCHDSAQPLVSARV